jgi:hypothetical protein
VTLPFRSCLSRDPVLSLEPVQVAITETVRRHKAYPIGANLKPVMAWRCALSVMALPRLDRGIAGPPLSARFRNRSPGRAAGLNLSSASSDLALPAVDFFGNSIPNSDGDFNIGCDGATI